MDKKLIVVTGGAGFIGSHVCGRLARDGHTVISLDNYFTGSKDNHAAGVEYREGHTKDIAKHIPETPDLIYHLGEYSRIAKSIEEPQVVWDLNMAGTLAVLEYWREKKCKLVYAGSSTKFESRDRSPYSWAKAANSDLVAYYGRWYDLPYSVVYFYNVYGPGERAGVNNYGTVVETFKQNYVSGTPYEVRGDGTQTRAFTHVEDTVDGILLAGEKGGKDEYAICAPEAYSILDLAKMFGGDITFLPPTKTTRSSGVMDTSKIQALGWKPRHTLAKYIKEAKAK